MSAPAVPADTVWLAPGRSGEPPRFRPPSVGPRRAPGTVRRGREPHPWAAAIRRGAPAANPSRARAPSPPPTGTLLANDVTTSSGAAAERNAHAPGTRAARPLEISGPPIRARPGREIP